MPRFNREELTEEQKVARHIEAMGHSEQLVLELVAAGVHSEDIHSTIKRNTDHLSLMLGKEMISTSGADLTAFQEAVTLGEAFILEPAE
jgi:hypothetical protein